MTDQQLLGHGCPDPEFTAARQKPKSSFLFPTPSLKSKNLPFKVIIFTQTFHRRNKKGVGVKKITVRANQNREANRLCREIRVGFQRRISEILSTPVQENDQI